MAGISNFYRGDTKKYKFDFGATTDITGWRIVCTLKTNKTDHDNAALLQVWALAGDDAADSPATGIMHITLPSNQTQYIPEGTYYYDFQRVIDGAPADVETLLSGKVKVLQDITVSVAP